VGGASHHKAELVVSPTDLTVYLLEDGKPHESTGTTMRAVIQQSGKSTTLNFTDQDGKRLVAKLPAPLGKGAIVVLTGKDEHGDPFNARYVIK
jgi:cytochrome c-type biogenesis protein CcmE